jgi:hypothetical protein
MDISSQKTYLKMRRVVHESLVLLRALFTKVPGTAHTLALEDSNWVLCVLEKMSRYPVTSVEPAISDYRRALWVDALEASSGRGPSSSVESVAKALKANVLEELNVSAL